MRKLKKTHNDLIETSNVKQFSLFKDKNDKPISLRL